MRENDNTKNYLLGILGVGIVFIAIFLVYLQANPNTSQNTISVSGNSEKEVMPDQAEIYISIQTQGTDAAKVQAENTPKSDKVIAAIKALGMPADKIETTSYDLQPQYNYNKDTGEQYIYGYLLTQTIKVTTDDIQNTGRYTDSAIKAGANSVQGVNFVLKPETQNIIRQELLAKASADAKTKAESIASGLGGKVGKVISVSEGQVYFPYYARAMEAKAVDSTGAPVPVPTTILPTLQTITANVQVTYEIR